MIQENLSKIKQELPEHVQLIVVSKFRSLEELQEVYDAGIRDFAENRVQELTRKQEVMPKDVRWHMIGHLQSNKVKYIAPFIHMIHSVDSPGLAGEINRQAIKVNRKIPCLLQVHIAQEESKFGFDKNGLLGFLKGISETPLPGIQWKGLMGMASLTRDEQQIKQEFLSLRTLRDELKSLHPECGNWQEISMGMSSDYGIAVECGSTMVRLGSIVFEDSSLR